MSTSWLAACLLTPKLEQVAGRDPEVRETSQDKGSVARQVVKAFGGKVSADGVPVGAAGRTQKGGNGDSVGGHTLILMVKETDSQVGVLTAPVKGRESRFPALRQCPLTSDKDGAGRTVRSRGT